MTVNIRIAIARYPWLGQNCLSTLQTQIEVSTLILFNKNSPWICLDQNFILILFTVENGTKRALCASCLTFPWLNAFVVIFALERNISS